ncbi:MAG: hypothetical protein JWQ90_4244 [Hydrocarboniphaga sp.]|nr:hypothetical protein [Hydrocarboniphaga sp.]
MRLPRLLRTTAVRFALRYALIYVLVLGGALAALMWVEHSHIDDRTRAEIESKLHVLVLAHDNGREAEMIQGLRQLQAGAKRDDRLFLLVTAEGARREGNLIAWPSEQSITLDGRAHLVLIEEEVVPKDLSDSDVFGLAVAWMFADGSRLLLIHRDAEAEQLLEITDYLSEVLGVAGLLALPLSLSLSHTMLRRMDDIGRTAADIAAGDLARRVPVSERNDEFDTLAARLNTMLDRIQQLVRGLREVTDNVAHDLRSPLARLRSQLEVALLEPRDGAEYRETLGHSLDDVDQLIRTFNALLGIAQAEAGSASNGWEPVNLDALAHDVADLYGPLAEEKGQTLDSSDRQQVSILGSRDLLAQALGNLLDNAIKYTPSGGQVGLSVRRIGNSVELATSDTGPGIAAVDRARVLERFVRLDQSRNLPGNGLGLSLVQAVARLHGAELVLADAVPGLVVILRFPLPPGNRAA